VDEPIGSRTGASRGDAAEASLERSAGALWAAAVLWYGIGDTATTLFGLGTDGVAEAGPIAGAVVGQVGPGGLLVVKIGAFAVFYAAWRVMAPPRRVGVPLALTVVGVVVTVWNLLVLFSGGQLS
jgi:hypothetical protein